MVRRAWRVESRSGPSVPGAVASDKENGSEAVTAVSDRTAAARVVNGTCLPRRVEDDRPSRDRKGGPFSAERGGTGGRWK
jgi:hypothetical protein